MCGFGLTSPQFKILWGTLKKIWPVPDFNSLIAWQDSLFLGLQVYEFELKLTVVRTSKRQIRAVILMNLFDNWYGYDDEL